MTGGTETPTFKAAQPNLPVAMLALRQLSQDFSVNRIDGV
jgi:hypothetical protein